MSALNNAGISDDFGGMSCARISWQILLQKSFFTGDQNFFWLYARLSCKDVGDLIA